MTETKQVVAFFRADNGCYCVPQCGGWELETVYYKNGRATSSSRSFGVQFRTKEEATEWARAQGLPVDAQQ